MTGSSKAAWSYSRNSLQPKRLVQLRSQQSHRLPVCVRDQQQHRRFSKDCISFAMSRTIFTLKTLQWKTKTVHTDIQCRLQWSSSCHSTAGRLLAPPTRKKPRTIKESYTGATLHSWRRCIHNRRRVPGTSSTPALPVGNTTHNTTHHMAVSVCLSPLAQSTETPASFQLGSLADV